jgi:hypothetical protein
MVTVIWCVPIQPGCLGERVERGHLHGYNLVHGADFGRWEHDCAHPEAKNLKKIVAFLGYNRMIPMRMSS